VSGSSLTSPELTISAGSGNVARTGVASRDVTVASQSGDTTLTFARVPGRVQVSAGSGDVTLVLPPGGTAYRVVARSSDGSTAVRVPTNPSSPHVITVTDQSGDIRWTTSRWPARFVPVLAGLAAGRAAAHSVERAAAPRT
jgi:DUF4097 and DUF4098 domain-containing protein YvlB